MKKSGPEDLQKEDSAKSLQPRPIHLETSWNHRNDARAIYIWMATLFQRFHPSSRDGNAWSFSWRKLQTAASASNQENTKVSAKFLPVWRFEVRTNQLQDCSASNLGMVSMLVVWKSAIDESKIFTLPNFFSNKGPSGAVLVKPQRNVAIFISCHSRWRHLGFSLVWGEPWAIWPTWYPSGSRTGSQFWIAQQVPLRAAGSTGKSSASLHALCLQSGGTPSEAKSNDETQLLLQFTRKTSNDFLTRWIVELTYHIKADLISEHIPPTACKVHMNLLCINPR